MRFIDEVTIFVSSGKGGDGSTSLRREKFVPFGGPDGGNGGDGGNILIKTDQNLNTLVHFRGKKKYSAPAGKNGQGQQKDGKSGDDLILSVPVGTVVFNRDGHLLGDLNSPDSTLLVAEGGEGGLGNTFYKSSTNRTPRFAQKGGPAVELELKLELKLLADIALIGAPNAGKSTLLSVISQATPKIADYPFTTLEPQLGVVSVDDKALVVADIPGLIEGASDGKGLGTKFLKHIERSLSLVHLIDISTCEDVYQAYEAYVTIRQELERFAPELTERKEIVCLSKCDSIAKEELDAFIEFFEYNLDKKVLPISAVSGKNIQKLKYIMLQTQGSPIQ